jgi:hypothetical protein
MVAAQEASQTPRFLKQTQLLFFVGGRFKLSQYGRK